MEEHSNDAAVATRYLLGELAEPEQRRYEEELMTGARSFEELLAAEDELIDRYVAGALAVGERERFEHHFLATPERRCKLSFARTLRRYVADAALEETRVEGAAGDPPSAATSSTSTAPAEASADETPADDAPADEPAAHRGPARTPSVPSFLRTRSALTRYAVAAVLLLLVSASAYLVVNRLLGPPADGPSLAFTLTPGAVRGASDTGVKQIHLPRGTGLVELRLTLLSAAAGHQRYRAHVAAIDEDRPVFSTPADIAPLADPSGTHVPVRLPARLLTPGNYKLRLTAAPASGDFQDIATYYFTVTPQ